MPFIACFLSKVKTDGYDFNVLWVPSFVYLIGYTPYLIRYTKSLQSSVFEGFLCMGNNGWVLF